MLYPFSYDLTVGGICVATIGCTACVESSGEIAPGAEAAEWTITELRLDGTAGDAQSGLVAGDAVLPEGGSDLIAALHADVMLALFRDKGHVATISALWRAHVADASDRGRQAFAAGGHRPARAAAATDGSTLAAFAARGAPRQPVRMEDARLPARLPCGQPKGHQTCGQPKRQPGDGLVLPFGERRP